MEMNWRVVRLEGSKVAATVCRAWSAAEALHLAGLMRERIALLEATPGYSLPPARYGVARVA